MKKINLDDTTLPLFFACIAVIIILGITLILWHELENQYEQSTKEIIDKQVRLVEQQLTNKVNSSVQALDRLASRWKKRHGIPEDEWMADVSHLINDLNALTTVEWVDSTYHVKRLIPLAGNEKLVNLNINFDGKHREALRIAEKDNTITITPPIRIVQGYDAFVTYVPLHTDSGFDGFIVGIYNLKSFSDDSFQENFHKNFNMRITDTSDNNVYDNIDSTLAKKWSTSTIYKLFNEEWKITLSPKKDFLSERKSTFSGLIVILTGSLFSLLVGFSIYTALISYRRNRLLYKRTMKLKSAQKEREHLIVKLANTNEELEKFAYIASHDLKSPLRAINNISQWLEEDLSDISDTSKKHLELLRNRVMRMERFLDNLLAYSRAGHNIEDSPIIAADAIISDVILLLNVTPGFDIKIDSTLKDIHIPRMPLEQIFHNLISNALKHHDKQTGVITISGRKTNDSHEFFISDDGPGIEGKFQEKIFEMFKTLKSRDEVEGSGIGLSLVKKILINFNGSIRLESELGKGTTFIFTWPIQKTNTE